jgi:hypothetical protein
MTLKDKILAAKDIKSELLAVPEWDVELEVRGMSARTRAKFLDAIYSEGAKDDEARKAATTKAMVPLLPDFLVDGCYDPATGERVFAAEDIPQLLDKNGAIVERVALKVIALSGLGEKAVDEAGKSSSDTQSDGSTSSSPSA